MRRQDGSSKRVAEPELEDSGISGARDAPEQRGCLRRVGRPQVDLVEQVEELAPQLQPVPFAVGHPEALEEREIGAGKRRPTLRVAAERSERPRRVLSEGVRVEPALDLVAARAIARQSGIAGEIDAVLPDSR